MKVVDLNELNLYPGDETKKYMNRIGYKSDKKLCCDMYKMSKHIRNFSIARISALQGINIDCAITKRNNKIRSWWYNPSQAIRLFLYYDNWVEENRVLWFCTKESVKRFWETHTLDDIMMKENQWYFDRMYFFLQSRELTYFLYHRGSELDKNYKYSLTNKTFSYIPIYLNESIVYKTMRILFNRKEIGNLLDGRMIRGCL